MNKKEKQSAADDEPDKSEKGKVVVADDDPAVLRTLTGLLEKLCYQVQAADSGEDALKILENEPADILITDIHMPGMDGIELMKCVRTLYPDMQMMIITGHGDIRTAIAAIKYGAFNYLQKPFRIEELEVAVGQGMEKLHLIREIRQKQAELEKSNEQLRKEMADRMQAEKDRDMHRQQLIQAEKMASLGILVSGIAHEINNPNNFIMMNTPILINTWENIAPVLDRYAAEKGNFDAGGVSWSQMRESIPVLLSGISEGSRRIRRIVRDLKEFARVDTENRKEPVDINTVVSSAVTLVGNLIRKSTDNFSTDLGENLPAIQGNFQKLEQVVINLLQNACQSLRDHQSVIRISTAFHEDSQAVILKVEDEGTGISEKDISHIMDPFYTTRRDKGGTGLGLSVSATIVREHGGSINVETAEGRGSIFTISLPVKAKKPSAKILVADDEDIFREFLVQILREKASYTVREAADGVETCIMLGRELPDLLVLDVQMPKMNGVEICRKIRADKRFTDMKVIIITGLPDSPEVKEILEMGFTRIYEKSSHIREFLKMAEDVLKGE